MATQYNPIGDLSALAVAVVLDDSDRENSSLNLLGHTLFPKVQSRFTEAKWIDSTLQVGQILQPSVIDTRPTIRANIQPTVDRINLLFRRESYRMTEQDRRDIFEASGIQYYEEAVARIYNGAARLVDGANVAMEMMPWRMLQDALIVGRGATDRGVDISYTLNYDADGSWAADHVTQLAAGRLWSNTATSQPVQDFEDIKSQARALGRPLPRRAFMNESTFFNMTSSDSLVGSNTILINSNLIIGSTPEQIRRAFEEKTGIEIIVYDKYYEDEQGEQRKYIDDGVVIFAPAGALGRTVWTPTPEHIDLNVGTAYSLPERGDDSHTAIIDEAISLSSYVKYKGGPLHFSFTCALWSAPSWETKKDTYVLRTLTA